MWILLDLAGVAFLFSLILTPLVRDAARRLNLVDRPDHRRKIHVEPIPRVGGVAIAAAYLLAFCFVLVAPYRNVGFDIPTVVPRAMMLLPAAGLVFAVGLLDDLYGLRPWQKLIGQVGGAGLAIGVAGVHIDIFHLHPLGPWISIVVTVIWLVGCTNAFNLIDGLDGLAAGVGLFATLTSLVAALTHGSLQLALATAPLAGCLLGFLRYNFNPASVFLGDSGSLLIGFLLGCYGAMWSLKSATILGLTAPMMALAIPLLDVALAIVRRFLRNQPIFGADRGHIHHRLLDRGLTPRRAALILYAICGIAAGLSLLQDMTLNHAGGVIIVLFCVVTWIGVQHLGYMEFGMARKLVATGTLRSFLDIQLRLYEFERNLANCPDIEQCRTIIVSGTQQFGFSGVRMCLDGRITEQRYRDPSPGGWQIRVELPGRQYVNFFGTFDPSLHPGLLPGLAHTVERILTPKLTGPLPGPSTEEAPVEASGTARTAVAAEL